MLSKTYAHKVVPFLKNAQPHTVTQITDYSNLEQMGPKGSK